MQMNPSYKIVLAGMLALALAACAQTGGSTASGSGDLKVLVPPVPEYAASHGVAAKLTIPQSTKDLKVLDLRSQRRNDVLSVQAEVANESTSHRRLYYRFLWLDADGMQVGSDESWKSITFLGRQRQYLKGVATRPTAVDFRIELRADTF